MHEFWRQYRDMQRPGWKYQGGIGVEAKNFDDTPRKIVNVDYNEKQNFHRKLQLGDHEEIDDS